MSNIRKIGALILGLTLAVGGSMMFVWFLFFARGFSIGMLAGSATFGAVGFLILYEDIKDWLQERP